MKQQGQVTGIRMMTDAPSQQIPQIWWLKKVMEKNTGSATPGILSKFPTLEPEALLTHRSTDGGGVWKEALQCIGPDTPIAFHSTMVN